MIEKIKNYRFYLKYILISIFFVIFLLPISTKAASLQQDLNSAVSHEDARQAIVKHNNGDKRVFLRLHNHNKPSPSNPLYWTMELADGTNVKFSPNMYFKSPLGLQDSLFWTSEINSNLHIEFTATGLFNPLSIVPGVEKMNIRVSWGKIPDQDEAMYSRAWTAILGYYVETSPSNAESIIFAWGITTSDAKVDDHGFDKTGYLETVIGNLLRENLEELLKTVGTAIGHIINYLLSMIEKILIVDVNQDGVIRGWAIVRNTANIMLIVALLFIALFNVTRFQIDYYNAKVLIPRLALAAIGINFSFLMTKAIIDSGNVMTSYFIAQTQQFNLLDTSTLLLFTGGGIAIGGTILAGILLGVFAFITALVALGILLAVLLFRFAVLYVLTIFSPLVFLFGVLPFTRGLTGMWWNYLVKWGFMGAVASLILMAGAAI